MTVENGINDTELAVVEPGLNIVSKSPKKVGQLRKLTLLDMTEAQVSRIKNLAEMQSALMGSPAPNFFMTILKGLELGFSPMAAIDNISLIKGKPTIDGKGMLALVYGSGLLKKLEFVEETDTVCTIRCERKDVEGVFEYSFSIEDAEKLGLLRNQQYTKQPKVMLKWRAVANLMRVAFPDVLGGVYTSEEIAPDTVHVNEIGEMTIEVVEPIVKSAVKNEPPKQKLDNASSSKDQSPAPVPTTAGETVLKAKTGENKLRKWLTDHEMKKSDFPGLLKELGGLETFGQVKETDETKFYQLLQDAHDRYVGIAEKLEAKKSAKKETKESLPKHTLKTEVLNYDGEAIHVNAFDGESSVNVKCYSRKKFAKLAGSEWAAGYGISELKAGATIEVDMLEIEYEIKTTKTASQRKYGIMTKVTVLTPDESTEEESEDGFDDFFPPEKSQS